MCGSAGLTMCVMGWSLRRSGEPSYANTEDMPEYPFELGSVKIQAICQRDAHTHEPIFGCDEKRGQDYELRQTEPRRCENHTSHAQKRS